MGIARSTYYDEPTSPSTTRDSSRRSRRSADDLRSLRLSTHAGGAAASGHRREPQEDQRLMREHELQPRSGGVLWPPPTATMTADLSQPGQGSAVDGPNQLWVADITYVAIVAGFVYVAVILDAWSRRVVGYAIGRSIDAG